MFNYLERNPFIFTLAVFFAIVIGGALTIIPDFNKSARPLLGTKPYSVLELAGKNIYINEGCSTCHSQLIRPFKIETDRYGMYSLSGEYAYDRPFLWGSKRTGPDLLRVGNYRTTAWHEAHMYEPQDVAPGSIMPSYKHMFVKSDDLSTAYAEAYTVNKVFNTPYNEEILQKDGSYAVVSLPSSFNESFNESLEQARLIGEDMSNQDVKDMLNRGEIPQIVALIAYLNSLK